MLKVMIVKMKIFFTGDLVEAGDEKFDVDKDEDDDDENEDGVPGDFVVAGDEEFDVKKR